MTQVERGAQRSYCGNSVLYFEYTDIDTIKNFGVPENIAQIDADRLTIPAHAAPLARRRLLRALRYGGAQEGERYLIDRKVSLPEKQRQFVLLSGGEIVWLVGRRIDDRYRLTDRTENVLRITKEIV